MDLAPISQYGKRIFPFFLNDFKVVLYDLMCSGSVNPDYFDMKRYSNFDAYVDDLFDILDELKVEDCVYVGHSMSAMIGCIASVRRPALFQKFLLLGASPRYLNDVGYEGGFGQEDIKQMLSAMESNFRVWVSGFAPLAVGVDAPAAINEFSRTLLNMNPEIAVFVGRTVFESDWRTILGHVQAPCYIIQSKEDVVVPLAVAEYPRTHLGGETWVEIIPTKGHLPQLSIPALVIQALKRSIFSSEMQANCITNTSEGITV